MNGVTQSDIAKALNLSRETVSKALNGNPHVSSATIDKVNKVAKEMGYVPNHFARSLVSRNSKTIGIVVPKISHSFFSNIVEFLYKDIINRGYYAIPMISFENKNNEILNIQTLFSMNVDGIIANISQDFTDENIYLESVRRGIPVVFFDRVIENPIFGQVTTNDRETSCEIVSYALSKGYERPAHLAGYTHINIGRERRNGFMDALNKYGITINPDWIIEGGFRPDARYKNAMNLLTQKDRPDLIFCFNDSVAECVYQVAGKLGISIPDELGVIGFGNLKLSTLVRPLLTTVDLPLESIAKKSVQLLMDKMEDEDETENVVTRSKLVIRNSCR
ncbi:MAG: LacI family DNA-binding transcriptional regulator [Bacteroidota bacterium]